MSGTSKGAKLAAQRNIERHGADFYKRIGSKGGSRTHKDGAKPKGFAAMSYEKRAAAGAKGGKKSVKKST